MKINGFVFYVDCFIDFYVVELIKGNVLIFVFLSVILKLIILRCFFFLYLVCENNLFVIIKRF